MFLQCGILSVIVFMFFATGVPAAEIQLAPFIQGDRGSISGRILIDGKEPLPGGIAAFFNARSEYPPKFGNLRRIPDHVTRVDPEGGFTVELPAGRYYLGVIIRDDPEETGPPGKDEKGLSAVDGEGKRRIFEIAGGEKIVDVGAIHVSTPKDDWKFTGYFTVRGTLVKKDGQPFAQDAWILVKRNPATGRPDLISEKITEKGQFELHLPAGRPYYLIARDMLGMGRPQPGRNVGAYTGPEPMFDQNMPEPRPIALSGAAGESVSGLRILMIEVPETEPLKGPMQGQPFERRRKTDAPDMK